MTLTCSPLAFADLPLTAQSALTEWLGDSDDTSDRLRAAEFTLRDVPVREMKALIMSDPELYEFADFETYHDWYLSDAGANMPYYVAGPRWPVITAGLTDEPVDDGWHRLHAYIEAGDSTVPLLTVDFGWPETETEEQP